MTDASGKFNFKLDTGCCFKVRGEKEKYWAVTTPDTICTKGLIESKVYLVNLNLQPTTVNPNSPTGNTGTVNALVDGNGKPMLDANGNPITTEGGNGKGQTGVDSPADTYAGLTFDPKTGLYTKDGKPFTGTVDGAKFKKGKVISGGKKPKNSDVVYFDAPSGKYMKGGEIANGKYNGVTYKDGIADKGFVPSVKEYSDDPTAQAYLLHIYYDFDQANIRDESKTDLDKLLKQLQDNPSFIVEIASHTDARGSNNYNNRLSQRRAEAVVRWLLDKGIERDRLVPRGYGEGMTANQCKNRVPCTEQEHQMNRRTEFRVLGCKDCVDKSKEKLSAPNPNAKVDKCKSCPF
jgi:outer membrane protein OmpA-like peptidoglycan-associated protein